MQNLVRDLDHDLKGAPAADRPVGIVGMSVDGERPLG